MPPSPPSSVHPSISLKTTTYLAGTVQPSLTSTKCFTIQDGLRSGLEAAAGITGKAVPWVGATSPRFPLTNTSSPSSDPPSPTTLGETRSQVQISAPGRGLVLPQPRVSLRSKAWSTRVMGWGLSMVEAVAIRAIAGFLRQTVVKVRALDLLLSAISLDFCGLVQRCAGISYDGGTE